LIIILGSASVSVSVSVSEALVFSVC
jgi:hypothetical protein